MSSEHIHLLANVGSLSMGKGLVFSPPDIKVFSSPFSLSVSKCLREGMMGGHVVG